MEYIQADKVPLKYMDGQHPVVFGIRPDGVKIDDGTLTNDQWAKTQAVVSVIEVLGGETLIYANLNIETPDAKLGQIIIKADADFTGRRGDIINIAISKRKFHVFDAQTEKSIRRRMPEENILRCEISGNCVRFEGQSFELPPAIRCADCADVELSMPITAITLGKGNGEATLQWIENIDGRTLYFLKAGELTLFAVEDGAPRFSIGDKVSFDIDMCKVSIPECEVKPLNTLNAIPGIFVKEKKKGSKSYSFYMEMEGQRLLPDPTVTKKLFACKGTKIFSTDIEYLFDASDIVVLGNRCEHITLTGKVEDILDYGYASYAKVRVGNHSITVRCDAKVGDTVYLAIRAERVTVKDRKLDIIIV